MSSGEMPDLAKLKRLRVADLTVELEKRGLDVSGLKADLVQRLFEAKTKEAAGGDAPADAAPAAA